MQSAVPTCCATLDRTHDPARVPRVVAWARAAGFDQVSLDLIYGTPGESLADWETSLDAALACAPDHVSAYSLIVEEGTALARRVRRGELPMPDDDDLADKYLLADERLTAAGLGWYEVSNWARDEASPVPAQPAYWTGARLVGRRPGRALPRRRRAVVERQAPGGVRRPARRRGQPGPRPRGARRRDPAGGAGAAGDAAARRACRSTCSTPPGRAAVPAWSTRGLRRATEATGWCSPARAGCSPTRSCGTCCPELSEPDPSAVSRIARSRPSSAPSGRLTHAACAPRTPAAMSRQPYGTVPTASRTASQPCRLRRLTRSGRRRRLRR